MVASTTAPMLRHTRSPDDPSGDMGDMHGQRTALPQTGERVHSQDTSEEVEGHQHGRHRATEAVWHEHTGAVIRITPPDAEADVQGQHRCATTIGCFPVLT